MQTKKTKVRHNFILFGMPGAGKTTHAGLLAANLPIQVIGLGRILRERASRPGITGLRIRRAMRTGDFVDDRIVEKVVSDVLDRVDPTKILLFDGYPRSLNQTYFLDSQLARRGQALPMMISLNITKREAIARLSGRRQCDACGRQFQLKDLKKKLNGNRTYSICPVCGGNLVTRLDDTPEAIKHRFEVMDLQRKILKHYYQKAGRFVEITASGSMKTNHNKLMKIIKGS
ncbi:MAG: nucleoside monophosphate kinase [Patescibacteria group bacterium]